MEEVFEALSEMLPMAPSLNDRLQHAPWAGFHLIEIKNHRDWCRPFVWIGMNAITIYLIVHFVKLEAIARCFTGGEIHASLERLHHGLGGLVTALLALGLAFLICRFLFQRKIFLRA